TKHLGDPRAGPAFERQQYGARPIRLAAITRNRQNFERRPLLVTRLNRRFARHVPPPRISKKTESRSRSVGQVQGLCFAAPGKFRLQTDVTAPVRRVEVQPAIVLHPARKEKRIEVENRPYRPEAEP